MSKMRQPMNPNAEALEGEFESSGKPPGRDMIEGGTIQGGGSSMAMALYVKKEDPKPRDMIKVEKNLLAEAEASGDLFLYSWGEGDNHIEGGSIKLANAMIRHYGNMACVALPTQETATSWIFTARVIDLETGVTTDRQFKQSKKSVVAGKMDNERKDDIRFQIGQSKANRNAILNATPEYLKFKALEAAKRGLSAFIENGIKEYGLAKMQDTAIKKLGTHGVTEERILAKFGHAKRSALDAEQLGKLSIAFRALNDGQERAEDLFPPITPPETGALKPGETMTAGGEIIPPKSTKEQLDEVIDRGAEKKEPEKPSNSEKPQETSQKEPERSTEAEKPETSNTPENLDAEPPEPGPPEYVESAAYKKLFDEVSGVTSKAGLTFMRKKIKEMQEKGEISPDEFAALEVNISEKRDGLAK